MVEHLDHLEVGVVGERQDHVAGPEPRVDATVDEVTAEQPPDALGGAGEAVRAGGEAEMVQAHVEHSAPPSRADPDRGSGSLDVENSVVGACQAAGRRGGAREPIACGQVPLAVRDQLVVRRTPHQLDELGLVGDVERIRRDVCLGVARAVPVEVVSAGSPSATVVLADRHLGVRRVVRQLDVAEGPSQRQLPADVRLRLERVAALLQRQRVQRAARAGREVLSVVEDAGRLAVVLDDLGLALALVVLLDPVRLLAPGRRGGTARGRDRAGRRTTRPASRRPCRRSGRRACSSRRRGRRRRCRWQPCPKMQCSATSARSGRTGTPGRRRPGRRTRRRHAGRRDRPRAPSPYGRRGVPEVIDSVACAWASSTSAPTPGTSLSSTRTAARHRCRRSPTRSRCASPSTSRTARSPSAGSRR